MSIAGDTGPDRGRGYPPGHSYRGDLRCARAAVVSQLQVPATAAGYAQLLAWARRSRPLAGRWPGRSRAPGTTGWAWPGTWPARASRSPRSTATRHVGRRRAGKSDPIDAVRAARELLARPHPAQMRADGDREALRLLMIDRDNAVQSGKTARTALASVLVTAPAPLREQLRHLPPSAGPASMRRADLPRRR